jgi:DNA-directed RNA polymerase specialized sigma24 family protein
LPDDLWREIERRHAEGMSYKAIRAEYRISLGTLSYRLSRTGKKTVLR